MRISDLTIQRVRDAIDIVELIGSYIDLKPSGKQMKACCPFHQEKTPSFFVTPEFGTYKCFGCGVSGDGIRFVMEMEHVDFIGAVRLLAERYHIPIESADPEESRRRDERSLAERMNADAAMFFYQNLLHSPRAQKYLMQRGLKGSVINDFLLGYADGRGDSLYRAMTEKGYAAEDLLRVGLIARSNRGAGFYDKFRDRIMFPIISIQDKIVGFGGRAVGEGKPKYLNSPDSEVFHKGEHLYGLNQVRRHTDRKYVILVEGYMDVVSLFYHGVRDAVASLGTSLTENQTRLIRRYADQIYLCYDGDAAGIRADRRAIDLFAEEGMTPKIVALPEGMDPDDVARREGAEAFETYLKAALDPLDFELRLLRVPYDLETAEGKLDFLKVAVDFLAGLESDSARDLLSQTIAGWTGVAADSLIRDAAARKEVLKKRKEKRPSGARSKEAGGWARQDRFEATDSFTGEERGDDFDPMFEPSELSGQNESDKNPDGHGDEIRSLGINKSNQLGVMRYRLEQEFVRLVRADEECDVILREKDGFIENEGARQLLGAVRTLREQNLPPSEELLDQTALSPEARDLLHALRSRPGDGGTEAARELLARIERFEWREREHELRKTIQQNKGGDAEQTAHWLQELMEIEKHLKADRGGRT